MQTKLWLGLFLNCWSWCSSSDLIKTLYLKEIFAFVIDLFILPENNYKHLQYLFKNLHTLLYKFFFFISGEEAHLETMCGLFLIERS